LVQLFDLIMNSTAALAFTVTESTQRESDQAREKSLANPGFGQYFTDHMVVIDWSAEQGWHDARVQPYGPLQVDPASSVLHYAQEIFEGLKASPR
jgi:branched-chain amino acid aminotransferase